MNYAGKVGEAQNVVDEIGKADGEALAIKADVSNSQEVRQLFDKTIEAFGDVDVLVNNAGIMTLSNIAATDDATFDRQIAVNLKGAFNGLREAAKRLRNYGRIINFSSSVIGLRLETYGSLCRDEIVSRNANGNPLERIAWTLHYRQRDRTWADGNGPLPPRKISGTHRSDGEDESA